MNTEPKRIVILGAGFGGIYTYLGLAKKAREQNLHITIVNRTNYFLFTPLLHEVATGGLNAHNVVEPIRKIIRKHRIDLCQAEVKNINLNTKIVTTSLGEIPYDYLAITLGATTNFYNVPGADKYALVLKDLKDAVSLRNRFIDAFEIGSRLPSGDERKKLLTFAVVGGGATGVELATEMSELFLETFIRYYGDRINCNNGEVAIHLIHSGKELLERFPQKLRGHALKAIKQKGIELHLNTSVTEVTKEGITLSDGSVINTAHTIWTAGVKPNVPKFIGKIALHASGRIETNTTFKAVGTDNIFAIGDVAAVPDSVGSPIPMFAQAARQEGTALAKNLLRAISNVKLEPFRYKPKGNLVSLGQWDAVGDIWGIPISGPIAWYIWRTVYLFNFASWAKRIKIAVDWTVNLFDSRDITKA